MPFKNNDNNPICSKGADHDRFFYGTATAGAHTDYRHGQRTRISDFLPLERIDPVCVPDQRGGLVCLRSDRTAIFWSTETVSHRAARTYEIRGRRSLPKKEDCQTGASALKEPGLETIYRY